MKGIVAAGHPRTAEAAAEVLAAGGNAFDAALAGLLTATVAEPILASLGGGGFLLAKTPNAEVRLYDFFVQTPRRKRPAAELDFRPILADFGAAQQQFHIGAGAVATPGLPAGIFRIHQDLGRMPLRELAQPAVELARRGEPLNRLQAYLFEVVAPIYRDRPETLVHYASPADPERLVGEGDRLRQPELADVIETLAIEGADLFYRGEIARQMLQCLGPGGCLSAEDLSHYRVELRRPLQLNYRNTRIHTNPPPSSGGILIAFGLKLLEQLDWGDATHGSLKHLQALAAVMAATHRARVETALSATPHAAQEPRLLDPALLTRYAAEVRDRLHAPRGTTQISVLDAHGNAATLTTSNGEGCGRLIPGTGIMPNNMLGEEDLNPDGFHRWGADQRIASMMAPTLIRFPDGREVATGSGGSNRIRTAILQVLTNLVDFGMPVEAAVTAPRIHLERDLLSIEGDHDLEALAPLLAAYPEHQCWDDYNLFFGGAHSVERDRNDNLIGCGDPRRDGVCLSA